MISRGLNRSGPARPFAPKRFRQKLGILWTISIILAKFSPRFLGGNPETVRFRRSRRYRLTSQRDSRQDHIVACHKFTVQHGVFRKWPGLLGEPRLKMTDVVT